MDSKVLRALKIGCGDSLTMTNKGEGKIKGVTGL